MLRHAASLGLPPTCSGCGRPPTPLCRACRIRLRRSGPRPPPPGVDRVVAALDYSGPARALLLDLKLEGARPAAWPLALEMVAAGRRSGISGDGVAWVPGRRSDIRRRGFDHARVLADQCAELLGLPPLPLLRRTSPVADQAGLAASERWKNQAGAFAAAPCSGRIVVVDDVVTTGATAASCARALRRAGAGFVELLVACSAESPR
jgi:predicted amidophosphoribosyltransferase